jgi:hypothetical protein
MMRSMVRVLVVVLALLALVGTVSAQINSPANGFIGGDSLFCNSVRGCWLLNSNRPANGSVPALLGEFPQADIQGALATCAASASNVIIGTIQGTFGPFTLSAVYDGPNADPICSLQINAFEAEGKESKPYGFAPKSDGSYNPVPQPIPAEEEVVSGGSGVQPPPPQNGQCIVDLSNGNQTSQDPVSQVTPGTGYDVYNWIGSPANKTFFQWSSTPIPLPSCP